jgi:hypothetical protein
VQFSLGLGHVLQTGRQSQREFQQVGSRRTDVAPQAQGTNTTAQGRDRAVSVNV